MEEELIELLKTMKLEMNNKILIAMTLKTDAQILEFVKWLKVNVPEEKIQDMEHEIIRQAILIGKSAR